MSPTPRRVAATALGALVGVLALLLPLVGAAPATARTALRAGVVAAPGASAATGPGIGDPRRSGRVTHRALRAVRAVRGPVRLARGERPAAQPAPRAARALPVPFAPASPATCGADPTGPPATWSTLLHPSTGGHAGRRTPVGAGRSPPTSCGH